MLLKYCLPLCIAYPPFIRSPATVIIQGIGVGMISTVVPVVILVVVMVGCDKLAGVRS